MTKNDIENYLKEKLLLNNCKTNKLIVIIPDEIFYFIRKLQNDFPIDDKLNCQNIIFDFTNFPFLLRPVFPVIFVPQIESSKIPSTYLDVIKYWENEPAPERYLKPELIKRSELVYKYINKFKLQKKSSILEIGCNAGRNLNFLYQQGYERLTGIDLSNNALKIFEEKNFDTFYHVKTLNESAESFFLNPVFHYNMIFALAAFEHLHSDSEWVFEKIAHSTKFILSISDEVTKSELHFPRNYKNIFESFGFKEIESFKCSEENMLNKNFIGRVLIK